MRTRTAPGGPEDAEVVPGPKRLSFNEPLSWRAGNKIAVAELTRRLTALAKELKDHDQEDVNVESLANPAKELVNPNLLDHKDPGVRALTACCLVDILRLCAPAAPFTASQLKALFTFLVTKIIPALADSRNPYNGQHLYVLHSLAHVKSIVLVTDVPALNDLVLNLFETSFDILSSPDEDLSRNLEYNMTGLLSAVVDESQGLPNEIIDIILAQFLRADPAAATAASGRQKKTASTAAVDPSQSTLRMKQLSPAYNMAKNICKGSEDRMARYVSQYFGAVIVGVSTRHKRNFKAHGRSRKDSEDLDSEDNKEENEPNDEDLKELHKTHRLLRELWKAAPAVLQNVIPQVEAELAAENVDVRLLATETIGDMASGIGAAGPPPTPAHNPAAFPPQKLEAVGNRRLLQMDPLTPASMLSFSQTHMTTYQSFLGRRLDKSPLVRAAWTKSIGHILSTSAGGVGLSPQDEIELAKNLSEMLIDSDEKVRLAAIAAVAMFELTDIVTKLGALGGVDQPGSLLNNLTARVKDRKPAVRTAAALLLGQLWGVAFGEIVEGNERVMELLAPIPSRILDAVYVNDAGIDCLVDRVIFESLWPVGFPTTKKRDKEAGAFTQSESLTTDSDADKIRTERLLTIMRDLDTKARVAFVARMARPKKLAEYMKAFLTRCEHFNGGVMDKDETQITTHLNRLIEFWSKQLPEPAHAAEDLMKFAKTNDRRNYSLIQFCMADASDYKKMHRSMKELNKRLDGLSTTTGTLPQTISALMYRISNLFYNRSHIHPIIVYSRTNEKSLGAAAHDLLKEISLCSPGAFQVHVKELCRVLEEQAPVLGKATEPGAEDNLKACAAFAHRFADDVPSDRKFLQAMIHYTQRGSPAATGKHAVSIIMSATDKKDMYVKDLLSQCVKDFEYGSQGFLAKLATLSQLMLQAKTSLDEEGDIDPVVEIAINQILLRNRTNNTGEQSLWNNTMDEETEAKVWTLKLLVNRLRAHDDAEAIKEIAAPVYQLLNNLVNNNGELSGAEETPTAQKNRLRLQAALLLLKLSSHKNFDSFLGVKAFNVLATVAQDPVLQVREQFITKIKKYLGQHRLPSRFYSIVFLLAFEPTRKLREDTVTWIKARTVALAKAKKRAMDQTFARLLSLLIHHPDFDSTEEELGNLIKYIMFYLRAVASEDNLSIILHQAQQLKGKVDAIDAEASDNLYYLSDLAVAVISQYEEFQNWSIQAYTGQIRLPGTLFGELPSDEKRQEIARKQYLPSEFLEQVEGLVKANMRNAKKRKSDSEADVPAKKRQTQGQSNRVARPKALPVRKAKKHSESARGDSYAAEGADNTPPSARRRSGRAAGRQSYAEADDSEDDADLEIWDQKNDGSTKNAANGSKTHPRKKTDTDTAPMSDSDNDLSDPPESDNEA